MYSILSRGSLLLALLLSACSSAPSGYDSTVIIHAQGGDELGVATDLGVVFLGRGQRSGEVDYTVFFGDGPSRERGSIDALASGLYSVMPELRLPSVTIGFPDLARGDTVILRGHHGRESWERTATVAANPRVDGLLLSARGLDELKDRDHGAGVYVRFNKRLVLVGLVRGRLRLSVDGGEQRDYLTVAGARDLIGLGLQGRARHLPAVPTRRHDALR